MTTESEFFRHSGLPHLEVRKSCKEGNDYRPHTHNAFSIGMIDEGTSVFAGSLTGKISLEAGDVILIPEGQVHACNPDEGRWRYRMVHMDQAWVGSLAEGCEAPSAVVEVVRHPDVYLAADSFATIAAADRQVSQVEDALRELLETITAVEDGTVIRGAGQHHLTGTLAPVFERLLHDQANSRLEDLAALVDMNQYRLARAVKHATGLSPLAWRQNARVLKAREMLRDGLPIADTAHELGFSDQSHFHRVFRAHVAASPGDYQR